MGHHNLEKKQMHRTSFSILTAAMVVTLASSTAAQTPKPDSTTAPAVSSSKAMPADSEFAHKASMGGKHEVEGAKFAAAKASNADVKAFASRLVKDHTMANQELMSLMNETHHGDG